MTIPPSVSKPLVDLISLIGEHAVVALIDAAIRRTKEAELRRNKTLFQRIFSRGRK